MAYIENKNKVYGDAQVYGNAWVSGNARVSGNAQVYGDARVYGNAWVYGDAQVYGDAWVSGNARVYGKADIQSNDDWFSFICQGKTLTGYRSRNDDGYELNLDGKDFMLFDIDPRMVEFVKYLISRFTPFESKEKIELKGVIEDLQRQLKEAQSKLENIK